MLDGTSQGIVLFLLPLCHAYLSLGLRTHFIRAHTGHTLACLIVCLIHRCPVQTIVVYSHSPSTSIYIHTDIYIYIYIHTGAMGSTSAPIRLAILEADTPLPNTNAKYHGYRGVFTDLFRRAVAPEPVENHLTISAYDVVNHPDTYPDLGAIDAVLISGSKHSAYLDEPWILKLVEFAKSALATDGRVKVVGVCFGHQIVGRALGTKVGVNEKGWEISVTDLKLTEKGRELFGSDNLVSGSGFPLSQPGPPLFFFITSKGKHQINKLAHD